MARGYRQSRPGLQIDVDMSEVKHAVGVLRGVEEGLRTEAHQNAVVKATHEYYSQVFDNEHMFGIASTEQNKDNFHHVYEYSVTGDPYSMIGNPAAKLWVHHLQGPRGGEAVASWKWRPATNPVPTYEQRRGATVGQDDIRNFSDEAFDELVEKSNGKRHVFVWKSVMLEYGIVANIIPQDPKKHLMVPMYGGKKRFAKQHTQGQQAPGPTLGRFTAEWVNFWGGRVRAEWSDTVGRYIEKDAKTRIETALKAGKGKPRKERRMFDMRVFMNEREAFEAGREQGLAAMRANATSMRKVTQNTGWGNALGYVDG